MVGNLTVCANVPVHTCTPVLVMVIVVVPAAVAVVVNPLMKLFAERLEFTSHIARMLAVGVELTPVPVDVPLMTGVVRVGEVRVLLVKVCVAPNITTVSEATLGKVMVLAVLPKARVWATLFTSTVSVRSAVKAVVDVAAIITSWAAEVSRIPNFVRPARDPACTVPRVVKVDPLKENVPAAKVPAVISEAAMDLLVNVSVVAFPTKVSVASGRVITLVPDVEAPVILKLLVPGVPEEPARK